MPMSKQKEQIEKAQLKTLKWTSRKKNHFSKVKQSTLHTTEEDLLDFQD